MQQVTILGATGSIGASTLDVLRRHPEQFKLFGVSGHRNVTAMLAICREFSPQYAVMSDPDAAKTLIKQLDNNDSVIVLSGEQALADISCDERTDIVMAAIVGAAGLLPTLAAIKADKRVLLANKEALVMTGQLFIDALRASKAILMPVDSEHNAIFQCLPVSAQQKIGYCPLNELGVNHLILTGSGGPFLKTPLSELSKVTPAQACKHPNWSMGQKISVDSATMMNKGLEYIEARWLFDTNQDQIEVVIHPQSVVHSMVQYIDGSVISQMGQPDMRTPIAYALSYPERITCGVKPLNFPALSNLEFNPVDYQRFPCLKLAIDACYQGQGATTALNAANEVAVAAFLNQQIKFTDIAIVNEQVLSSLSTTQASSLELILEVDRQARNSAQNIIKQQRHIKRMY
ncbi:MAG: 1-deoxy-D-xylulose-5-phosphate reductoisomerase [Gammaproteobacteria bacterium]|nr:1-deoxy-D-xylulose-5-phosphate reductoisomerase [Gammaproteobacteria bacterium]